jgi:hypothetical protein
LAAVAADSEPGAHRGGLEIEIGVTANPVLVQPVLSAGAEHAEPYRMLRRRLIDDDSVS